MSFSYYSRYDTAARQLATRESFEEAAHAFTSAAHEILGKSNYASGALEHSQVDTARGLRALLSATLCYTLASNTERARVRATQGISLANEIRDHVATYDPQRGLMWEYAGDYKVLAGMDSWPECYDSALEHYVECDNVLGWVAEPEFEINTTFLLEIAAACGYQIDRQTKQQLIATSLERRIEFKRDHMQHLVEAVVTGGRWP